MLTSSNCLPMESTTPEGHEVLRCERLDREADGMLTGTVVVWGLTEVVQDVAVVMYGVAVMMQRVS